ncbi:tyrosine-type recombinase/integrase [Flindersiella endophytica]
MLEEAEQAQPEREGMSWFELARAYVAERWDEDAAKTREGIVDALATATLALLDAEAKKLDRQVVRPAMRWALVPTGLDDHPDKYGKTIAVLSRHTLPVAELATPEVARRLRKEIGQTVDGARAATDTARGRRRKLNTALEYAVDLGELAENPLHTVEGRKVKEKKVARDVAIDPRVVANPRQVRELLTCVSYIGSYARARGRRLVAFYATIYYAGCRPSEATALRRKDCHLPDNGWGLITFSQARPQSEKRFTDTGKLHDQRGLKQREADATRSVPIPPILVAFLRQHLDTFGIGQAGLVFHTERGWPVGKSMYAKVWREARNLALRPEQAESPLAAVPYDLRHAALSLWLNSGMDPTDVAERAGDSVEILFRWYAKCLDGRKERNNRLVEAALNSYDPTTPTPATKASPKLQL